MCGIAGIIDLEAAREIDRDALTRMTRALAHRGPDGEGFTIREGVGLGHRRLSIIDPEGGAQPFETPKGALVTNGEIYNFRDLKEQLGRDGLLARTRSDTEVLALGLGAYGAPFISRLTGMFAFAYFDEASRTTLLARDRFGEKPLYYATTPDGFLLFASEACAIAASRLASLEFSNEAARDYFLYGFVPDPKTIYRGVSKLSPGCCMLVGGGREAREARYWSLDFNQQPQAEGFDRAAQGLIERLDASVSRQMISDFPLGAFLSGGVDSAAIVASMAQRGGRVHACTIGFDDPAFDERAPAAMHAQRYEVDHHIDEASIDDACDVDHVAAIYGEPFADSSAVPTLAVCKAARRHVKVALSGDGADEIFGGYRRYGLFAMEDRLRRKAPLALRKATFGALGAVWPKLDRAPRPLRLKTTLQSLGETSAEAYARAVGACLPDRVDQFLSGDFKATTRAYDPVSVIAEAVRGAPANPLGFAQAADIGAWLPGRMLVKVDRASMANGLETRAPFLDHTLAQWGASLPPDWRRSGGVGKRILKRALETRVDRATLYGEKRGFAPPLSRWLRRADGPLRQFEESAAWRTSGFLDPVGVARMAADHRAARFDYSQELWTLIMFDAFLRRGAHHIA